MLTTNLAITLGKALYSSYVLSYRVEHTIYLKRSVFHGICDKQKRTATDADGKARESQKITESWESKGHQTLSIHNSIAL